MKWIPISDIKEDLVFPCIVTDGKRVMYIPKLTPLWSLSNEVSYKDITHYIVVGVIPHQEN